MRAERGGGVELAHHREQPGVGPAQLAVVEQRAQRHAGIAVLGQAAGPGRPAHRCQGAPRRRAARSRRRGDAQAPGADRGDRGHAGGDRRRGADHLAGDLAVGTAQALAHARAPFEGQCRLPGDETPTTLIPRRGQDVGRRHRDQVADEVRRRLRPRPVEGRAAGIVEQALAEGGVEMGHGLAEGRSALRIPHDAVHPGVGAVQGARRGEQLVRGARHRQAGHGEQVGTPPQQLGVRLDRQAVEPPLPAQAGQGGLQVAGQVDARLGGAQVVDRQQRPAPRQLGGPHHVEGDEVEGAARRGVLGEDDAPRGIVAGALEGRLQAGRVEDRRRLAFEHGGEGIADHQQMQRRGCRRGRDRRRLGPAVYPSQHGQGEDHDDDKTTHGWR
jgi:hypothetical protein